MTKRLFENQVILGDCLEKMKDIADDSIDLILTDLPYGMTDCNWDNKINMKILWFELTRIAKKNCVFAFTSKQPFTTHLVNSNFDMFKYEIIWKKSRGYDFFNAKTRIMQSHENILIFYNNKPVFNPQMRENEKNKIYDYGKRKEDRVSNIYAITSKHSSKNYGKKLYPLSIIEIDELGTKSRIHPTQKPVELFEYLIKTYSNEGDTVLDCCAGSGTTAIACFNTNRRYICIEKDTKYFEVMKERIKNHPQKITEFVTQ